MSYDALNFVHESREVGGCVGEEVSSEPDRGGAAGTESIGIQGAGGGIQADSCPDSAAQRRETSRGSDDGQEIPRASKVGTATVERVRRRCVEQGVEATIGRKSQLNCRPKDWMAMKRPA